MSDLIWLPIINEKTLKGEPIGVKRELLYGSKEEYFFETKEECQHFCDIASVIKIPQLDYDDAEPRIVYMFQL